MKKEIKEYIVELPKGIQVSEATLNLMNAVAEVYIEKKVEQKLKEQAIMEEVNKVWRPM